MRYRLLGPTGLRVSELFLGAMTFAGPDEARKMIDLYAGASGNVIDTASAYGDSQEGPMVAVAQQAGITRRQTEREPAARLARWAPRTRKTKRLGWTR